ncbi:glycoside hydrolase [Mesorhizobium sp. Root552]|uniref:lysozyme n=1 Tax=Mesorhizobium sp. Root552 TaxID=1736555 RepID=UPI0006FB0F49|nr:lysozyme [Mesorhizobium sp. Root552]KQZ25857.1 glycoside hydrolase [Mesorhizobium sp. Root552]
MLNKRLTPSKRAKAAIAAVVAASTSIGGLWYVVRPGEPPIPDDVVLASEYLVKPWEGEELRAYLDVIAKPPVWTICNGDTENVRKGMVETPEGCKKRLRKRLTKDFRPALVKCIDGFGVKPLSWRAMMLSLSYNVGIGAGCKSTAAKLGRLDQYYSSCVAATAFNKAGGKMIVGLANRREMGDATRIGEGELCVSGVQ